MLWLRSRNSCSRTKQRYSTPLAPFTGLPPCKSGSPEHTATNLFQCRISGGKKNPKQCTQYFFLVKFVQQICGYFLKKFRQLLLTNKPAEKIFDKCPQSCVNSRSPRAFPHSKIQNISYCQGQDSHNVLASYQDKNWTDTALQSQALVSTMGKLHYKGKENFTEYLTKFPDTHGQDTKTASIQVKHNCLPVLRRPIRALHCHFKCKACGPNSAFRSSYQGTFTSVTRIPPDCRHIRFGPMGQISGLPERNLRLLTVFSSETVFGMPSLHKTSLDRQVMCFCKQSTTCVCKAY